MLNELEFNINIVLQVFSTMNLRKLSQEEVATSSIAFLSSPNFPLQVMILFNAVRLNQLKEKCNRG